MILLIVGAGSIGRRHVANASSLAEVLVYDAEQERADAMAEKYAVSACHSLEQALAASPRAAIVATPHTSHVAIATQLIEAGCDVMLEKPIADNVAVAQTLVQRAAALQRQLFVVCNMRFHPGPDSLKTHLPAIGTVLFARAHFGQWLPDMRPDIDYRQHYCAQSRTAGGVLLDNIHEIDYLQWLFGPIKNVQASLAHISKLELDVEDYAAINLEHENGVRSTIHLDYLQACKRRGCEIVGSEGTLLWESEDTQPERCRVRLFRRGGSEWERLYDSADVDANAMYITLLEKFMRALQGDRVPDLLRGDTALEELKVALAAKNDVTFIDNQADQEGR